MSSRRRVRTSTLAGALIATLVVAGSAGLPDAIAATAAGGCDGEILGTKYWDQDCDGVRDPGEPGLPGWTIALDGPGGQTAVTDVNGNFHFIVSNGSHTVTEITQPLWVLTDPPGGVHTVTVGCDEVVTIEFGNCLCDDGPSELPPPCTVGWYPLDEGAGASTSELVVANHGGVFGAPIWVPGLSSSSLDFTAPVDFVEASQVGVPAFGNGDFAVSAWIRTGNPNPNRRTIVDKSDASSSLGWHLYIQNGRLGLDVDDGTLLTYQSTGTVLTDGLWHQVTAVLCRDISGVQTGGAWLYVDGILDAFFNQPPVFSVDANVRLRIGQRCPTYPPTDPVGQIDEVMLFDCCLDASEVAALHTANGFASAGAYVPSSTMGCGPTASTTLQICNYAAVPRTYTWTIAGRTAGGVCTIPGPQYFTPVSGTVTIPAGVTCTSIPITITLPPGLTGSNVACYDVTILEHETGKCIDTSGTLRAPTWVWADPSEPVDDIPIFQSVEVEFQVLNTSAGTVFMDVQLVPWDVRANGPSGNLSLDGLPPGEPVVRTVKLPPGILEPVGVTVQFELHDPFNVHELRLLGDLDGTGVFEPLSVMGLRTDPAGVSNVDPEIGLPGVEAAFGGSFRVGPNPFTGSTTLHFESDRKQSVSLRVFDASGRLVSRVFSGTVSPGRQSIEWDGRNEQGIRVAPGIYLLEAQGARGSAVRKVMSIR